MFLVIFFGQALLGLGVSFALAWILLLVAPAWFAGGFAAFCAATAVVVVAGADDVRSFSPPRVIIFLAGGTALLGVGLSGATVDDVETLGWWVLGVVLGLFTGMIATLIRER